MSDAPDLTKPLSRFNASYWAMEYGIAAALDHAAWKVLCGVYHCLPDVHPGKGRIERVSGVSMTTVKQARRTLKAAGLINYPDNLKGGSKSETTHYSVTDIRQPGVAAAIVAKLKTGAAIAPVDPRPGINSSHGGDHCPGTGAATDPGTGATTAPKVHNREVLNGRSQEDAATPLTADAAVTLVAVAVPISSAPIETNDHPTTTCPTATPGNDQPLAVTDTAPGVFIGEGLDVNTSSAAAAPDQPPAGAAPATPPAPVLAPCGLPVANRMIPAAISIDDEAALADDAAAWDEGDEIGADDDLDDYDVINWWSPGEPLPGYVAGGLDIAPPSPAAPMAATAVAAVETTDCPAEGQPAAPEADYGPVAAPVARRKCKKWTGSAQERDDLIRSSPQACQGYYGYGAEACTMPIDQWPTLKPSATNWWDDGKSPAPNPDALPGPNATAPQFAAFGYWCLNHLRAAAGLPLIKPAELTVRRRGQHIGKPTIAAGLLDVGVEQAAKLIDAATTHHAAICVELKRFLTNLHALDEGYFEHKSVRRLAEQFLTNPPQPQPLFERVTLDQAI